MSEEIELRFEPEGKKVKIKRGKSILEAAHKAGILIDAPCGGKGLCGKCKVKIRGDDLPLSAIETKLLKPKEIEEGIRLACQFFPQTDLTVEILTPVLEAVQKSELERTIFKLRGANIVKKYFLVLPPPSLNDQRSDEERLLSALPAAERLAPTIRSQLPAVLRDSQFKVTAVVVDKEVIAIEKGNTEDDIYGVAIDIGTTTLAAYLVHLPTGRKIASSSILNPQTVYGADVVSRIRYTMDEDGGLEKMRRSLIDGVNKLLGEICGFTGVCQDKIYQATIVGNTCMTHFLLGVDARYLAFSPYVPAFSRMVKTRARNVGLKISPESWVYVLPNIAGFVGADTVGVILATGLYRRKGIFLAIDIGTNGEMALGCREGITVCSTAAGPAFEGAHIKFGMHATTGAINRVYITDDVKISTIEGEKPRGICGSGLLDAVAEMYKVGIIDYTGRMLSFEEASSLSPSLRERLKIEEGERCFVLSWGRENGLGRDIYITQKDIRELQLAKGAMRAGIEILLKDRGISKDDIDGVFLAGAFGNYIRKESALQIGLLPPLPLDKIYPVGNAAGRGAMMALVSPRILRKAEAIARGCQYIELSALPEFSNFFMDAMYFPI
ncbi:MAG: ASKHA domain-containing protein [bacterium]